MEYTSRPTTRETDFRLRPSGVVEQDTQRRRIQKAEMAKHLSSIRSRVTNMTQKEYAQYVFHFIDTGLGWGYQGIHCSGKRDLSGSGSVPHRDIIILPIYHHRLLLQRIRVMKSTAKHAVTASSNATKSPPTGSRHRKGWQNCI